ncbi:MAG TPA: hypothetical protein VH643_23580 [Gemmataceae bacterium]|jgi:hypothetical protein
MTEAEWLSCMEPERMLLYLGEGVSKRKRELFTLACCRRIWHLLTEERSRWAVEVRERHADGQATEQEFQRAVEVASDARQAAKAPFRFVEHVDERAPEFAPAWAAAAVATNSRTTPHFARRAVACVGARGWDAAYAEERAGQAMVVRDMFTNPFRSLMPLDPAWLQWNDSLLVNLASAVYEHRSLPDGTLDRNRLAVLGDALEEAGCTDAELLAHLRSPGTHVRGCFALDAVLGKS